MDEPTTDIQCNLVVGEHVYFARVKTANIEETIATLTQDPTTTHALTIEVNMLPLSMRERIEP